MQEDPQSEIHDSESHPALDAHQPSPPQPSPPASSSQAAMDTDEKEAEKEKEPSQPEQDIQMHDTAEGHGILDSHSEEITIDQIDASAVAVHRVVEILCEYMISPCDRVQSKAKQLLYALVQLEESNLNNPISSIESATMSSQTQPQAQLMAPPLPPAPAAAQNTSVPVEKRLNVQVGFFFL
jgi:hypothetical protein